MSVPAPDPARFPGLLLDPGSVKCFGDAHPATAVDADGYITYWLLDVDHECDGPPCCTVRAPEHERLGRLPAGWRTRISRCAAVAVTTGQRCARPALVGEPFCYQHRGGDTMPGPNRRRPTVTVAGRKRIVDDDGDAWPVTGHTCSVCGWPLDELHAETGTHPGCDERADTP